MRKNLLLIALFVLTWISAMAVPAKPGLYQVTQSDGTTLTIQLVGDEWFSLTLTSDNLVVDLGDDGDYYYITTNGISNVKAHDAARRNADELSFIDANKELMTVQAMKEAAVGKQDAVNHLQSVRPKVISNMVPTQGDLYVPVILVDFKDVHMYASHDTTAFRKHLMTKEKSVREYFYDQSNGKLNLHFEVFGPYEISSNISTYAKHRVADGYTLNDAYRGTLVSEAVIKAEKDVRWKRYCNDKKSPTSVNMVIVMCAGTNEAQGGGENAIWPCEWSLSAAGGYPYYDGDGALSVTGADGETVTVNQFAILTEYAGSNTGSKLDGIGTFCHEFSHCLGLPDFYNTGDGHSYTGLDDWSIMADGCYYNSSNTPVGYSGFEKQFMGWIDYTDPEPGEYCTLPSFNNTNAPNDKVVRVKGLFDGYVDYNKKRYEYWLIENRQRNKWDIGIPYEGVLISHYVFNYDDWYNNRVNNTKKNLGFEEAKVVGVYGGLKTEFTQNSSPAMAAYINDDGSVSNPPIGVNKPVTEIKINNGVASFYYIKGGGAPQLPKLSSPILNAASDVQATSFTASWSHTSDYDCTYTLLVSQYGSIIREVNNITTKSFTVDNLNSGETYVFKVKAVPVNSDATESDWSAQKEVKLDEVHTPVITATPTSLNFTGFVNESYSQTVNVTGSYLSQDIEVELVDGSGDYFIDKTSINKTANGAELTITWTPKTVGTSNASIRLTSNGAQTVTIGISGEAQPATPTLMVDNNSLLFLSAPSVPKSKTISVTGRFITNNVSISLNNPGVFSVYPTTIDAASLANGNSVDVTVTFVSENEGDFTGSLTLSSEGAESQSISLSASASNGGNATDAYLNIANYNTIKEAGAVVEGMENIYKYTENLDEGVAWLTISNYGVVNVAASQKWITNEIEETYSIKNGWAATDIFLGHKSYFGDDATNGYSAKWRTSVNSTVSQFFYVTNCTQVKQLARNSLTSSDNLYMYIYECTKNDDGTLNEGTTPIDVQKSYTADVPEVLTSCDLEAEKIYKVEIRNSFSHLYEIGFKTEINNTPVITPVLSVSPDALAFDTYVGEAESHTFTVTGENISESVNIVSSNDNFTVSPTTIAASDLAGGKSVNVTVTFAPQAQGNFDGNITITTNGAQSKTVALNGKANVHTPVIDVTAEQLAFETSVGTPATHTFMVSGQYVASNVSIISSNENFTVSPATIEAGDLAGGKSVNVTVTFAPQAQGSYNGYLTITTDGAQSKTIALSGEAAALTPVINVTAEQLAFETSVGTPATHTFMVSGQYVASNVSIISSNENFTVSPATIEAGDLVDGNSVNVTVTFTPQAQGSYNGYLTITTDGAQSKTIALNGEAVALAINAPRALAATSINTNTFTANWNTESCAGASSYILRVVHEMRLIKPKPTTSAVLKLTETFNDCDGSNDEITDAYTDVDGWQGIRVYVDDNAVRIGGSSAGSLVSPGVDLSDSNGKVSIKFKAKTYSKPGNYQYQSADNPLKISCGTESQTIIVPSTTNQEFTIVLSCSNADNQKITFANTKAKANVIISDINIYSGDVNATSGGLGGSTVVVVRDTTIYTGITANHFKVTGLRPMNNYTYDVKAVYGDQESDWSNSISLITRKRFTPIDDIIINGRINNDFIINDDLLIVHVNASNGQVWCKDLGNASVDATQIIDGQIDFMREVTHEQTREWDQSNWILLQFPVDDGSNGIKDMLENAEGKTIVGGTVYGIYTDDVNYTLTVLPEDDSYALNFGDYEIYEKNLYCIANFMPSNLNVNGGTGAIGRINGEDVCYFFMNPKIQEVCEITDAEFDGNGMFVVPANNNMLEGSLKVDWKYNAYGTQWPEKGNVYHFTAVVNRVASRGQNDGSIDVDSYIVYPLDFDANGNTLTGVGTINGSREAIGVEYVNVSGLVSNMPFKGVNIVVTRYSDGSSTVVKKLYK